MKGSFQSRLKKRKSHKVDLMYTSDSNLGKKTLDSKQSAQAQADQSESKSKESYNPFLKDEIGAGVAIDSWLK